MNEKGDPIELPIFFFEPPSLRKQAPARISITLPSGECLPVSRRRIDVHAGRPFAIQVIPPHSNSNVNIVAEGTQLQQLAPVSKIAGADNPVYYVQFSGESHKIPIPASGKIHITIQDGNSLPFHMTIRFRVWPTIWTIGIYWALVFFAIAVYRLERTVAHTHTYSDIFDSVVGDLPFLGVVFLFGLLVAFFFFKVAGFAIPEDPWDTD